MSRYADNEGCFLSITIILCLVAAVQGEFAPLLYIGGFMIVLWLFGYALDFFSGKKSNTTLPASSPTISISKKTYDISIKQFKGSIDKIPQELSIIKTLEIIEVSSKNEIEISKIIEQNQALKSITLSGPIFLDKKVKLGKKIETVMILNTDINIFLGQLKNPQQIKSLTLKNVTGINGFNFNIFESLEYFKITNCSNQIPNISSCKQIKYLYINYCSLYSFPSEYLILKNLKSFSIANNQISILPKKFISQNLININLETIDLSSNHISSIPKIWFDIKNLKKIYINGNPFGKYNLKRMYRKYGNVIAVDYKQRDLINKPLSPSEVKLIRFPLTVFILLIPYLFFDSILSSGLLSFYFVFLGGFNFLFRKN